MGEKKEMPKPKKQAMKFEKKKQREEKLALALRNNLRIRKSEKGMS